MIYPYSDRSSLEIDLTVFGLPEQGMRFHPGLNLLLDEPNTKENYNQALNALSTIQQSSGGRLYQRVLSQAKRTGKNLAYYNNIDSENVLKLNMNGNLPMEAFAGYEVGACLTDMEYNITQKDPFGVDRSLWWLWYYGISPDPIERLIGLWRYKDGDSPIIDDSTFYSGDRSAKDNSFIIDMFENTNDQNFEFGFASNGFVRVIVWGTDHPVLEFRGYNSNFAVRGELACTMDMGGWNRYLVRRFDNGSSVRIMMWSNNTLKMNQIFPKSSIAGETLRCLSFENITNVDNVFYGPIPPFAYSISEKRNLTPYWETYGDFINFFRETQVSVKPFWDMTSNEFEVLSISGNEVQVINRGSWKNFQGHERFFLYCKHPVTSEKHLIGRVIEDITAINDNIEKLILDKDITMIPTYIISCGIARLVRLIDNGVSFSFLNDQNYSVSFSVLEVKPNVYNNLIGVENNERS